MAKVVENTQRDLNIAFMNEIAIICGKLGIRTSEVLEAAKTKWNFLPFTPGLVAGHCIGVDSYYLTAKAEELGYYPEVILAGRRINNNMGKYIAQKLVKLMIKANLSIKNSKVVILGITFKENISDLRNSRIPNLIIELKEFEINPLIHDPLADSKIVKQEYDIDLVEWKELVNLDAVILAVSHQVYIENFHKQILPNIKHNGVLMDIKSIIDFEEYLPSSLTYWSL